MTRCAVKWCVSNRNLRNVGISFHSFPRDVEQRQLWMEAVRHERRDRLWTPTKYSVICSIHFTKDDIHTTVNYMRMLTKDAVPICTMVFQKHIKKEEEFILPHGIDFIREESLVQQKSPTLRNIVPIETGVRKRIRPKKTYDVQKPKSRGNKQNNKLLKQDGPCIKSDIEENDSNLIDVVFNECDLSVQNYMGMPENNGLSLIAENMCITTPNFAKESLPVLTMLPISKLKQENFQIDTNINQKSVLLSNNKITSPAVEDITADKARLPRKKQSIIKNYYDQNKLNGDFIESHALNIKVGSEKRKSCKGKTKTIISAENFSTNPNTREVIGNNLEDFEEQTYLIADATENLEKNTVNITFPSPENFNCIKSKNNKSSCPNCGFDLEDYAISKDISYSDLTREEEPNLIEKNNNNHSKLSLVSISFSEEY